MMAVTYSVDNYGPFGRTGKLPPTQSSESFGLNDDWSSDADVAGKSIVQLGPMRWHVGLEKTSGGYIAGRLKLQTSTIPDETFIKSKG